MVTGNLEKRGEIEQEINYEQFIKRAKLTDVVRVSILWAQWKAKQGVGSRRYRAAIVAAPQQIRCVNEMQIKLSFSNAI